MRGVLLAAGALLALVLVTPSGAKRKPAFPIAKPRWLAKVQITEYYPAPESWFVGKRVKAPGLKGKHRVDWLYSAAGISMEGDGIGLDGRPYHLAAIGKPGWVNAAGRATAPGEDGWTRGWPAWRFGGWRNADGAVTFPLQDGGWSNGKSVRRVRRRGVLFAGGRSSPSLRRWRSIAVDRGVIPLGSHVFVPAYCPRIGHAWFRAQDTGGAIQGRHIDVYRSPPRVQGDDHSYASERIFVVPPGTKLAPGGKPTCADFARRRK